MITISSNDLNFSVQINEVSTIFHVSGTVIGHSNEDEPLTMSSLNSFFKRLPATLFGSVIVLF